MTVTIKDVARLAGVAASTVSKVMNDSPRISQQTKTRVQAAMQQLEYYPSRHARGLARNRSESIGVLMPMGRQAPFHNPYLFEILCGIELQCTEQNFTITLLNSEKLASSRKAVRQLVAERKVDAVLLHYDDFAPALIRQFESLDLPFVVIGQGLPGDGYSWVDMDNRYAAVLATQHLLSQGYQRLQFVGNNVDDNITQQRAMGFEQALEIANVEAIAAPLFAVHGQYEEGASLWQQLCRQHQRPDALLVAGNPLAAGLLNSAKDNGVNIGPELGIFSFDNYPFAELTVPPMSVVDIDLFALGYRAAQELFIQLTQPFHRVQTLLLDMQLRARASSQS